MLGDTLVRLRTDLAASARPSDACTAVVRHLGSRGLMPSAYLASGDRLRLMGAHGYWQVYDGMPADAGVISATWRTGRRHLLTCVTDHPTYLAASSLVTAELCVPLHAHGTVVGALNVESLKPLTPAQEAEVDRCGRLLSSRLDDLPRGQESPAQKLSRHAVELVALAGRNDQHALEQAVVLAATDLSGHDTALLIVDVEGELTAVASRGPLAPALTALRARDFALVARWVERGTSVYTTGTTEGVGFPGHEALRRAGAGSVVVLPLRGSSPQAGMVLLCDSATHAQSTDQVALLELLASQVSTCLQVSAAVAELSDRANRDALTTLGHHAAFQSALPRQRAGTRRQLAVLYLDVDHFKRVNDTRGHAAGDTLLVGIATTLKAAVREDDRVFRIGGDEFAVLAHVQDRDDAVALGQRLLAACRSTTGASLSVGVAVAAPLEPDAALLARADTALYEVKQNGRGNVLLHASDEVTA